MSEKDYADRPILEQGQIIPAFTLPGTDGMPHSPWDYKQKDHLLLIFTNRAIQAEGLNILRGYAQHYSAFREEHCAILVVTSDPVLTNLELQEKQRFPFPLVSDVQGTVIARYTHWDAPTRTLTPSLILADRYGALYQYWSANDATVLPAVEELLESLRYLNSLCTP